MHKKLIRAASLLLTVLLLLSIPAAVSAENIEEAAYTVTLAEDSRVNYSGVPKLNFALRPGAYTNVYANVTEGLEDDWYIADIAASPADAAEVVFYQNTGDILIKNVTADLSLTPVVEVRTKPVKLDVSWEFPGGGIYSEDNAAATVQFTVKATDADGNPAVNAKLYYKSDVNEKSFTNALRTDLNGVATIKHAYGLNAGEDESEFTAQFAADEKFTELLEESSLKVVLQKKSDLYLTTDQVKQSRPNNADGGVIRVDPLYEYFTGVLHQKAINTASGEWVTPENGVIEGLSPGQYALRWRERREGDTVYLHSDYDYFTIERAIWTVKADTENAEHLTFADSELYTSPGGDVFFYVAPDEGYRVADYTVTKPNYVSDIIYNEDDGYIWLRGITGNFTLKASAESAPAPADDPKEDIDEAPVTKALLKSSRLTALGASGAPYIDILDVYQSSDIGNDGTHIYVKYKVYDGDGNPVNVTYSNTNVNYKQTTASKYSTYSSPKTHFAAGEETGVGIYEFSVSASTSAERIYDAYISYGSTESAHITLNLRKTPSIKKTEFSATNEKGDRANGTITYNGTGGYTSFVYNKQSSSVYYRSEGSNVIKGLESGTWYVYVAPFITQTDTLTYEVRVRSSSASVAVGWEEDDGSTEQYTVKFANAAGEVVSEQQYEEGTRASSVAVPANTADKTENGYKYTYAWPTVSDVNADVTYREIETKTAIKNVAIAITDIAQNKANVEGKYLSVTFTAFDEDSDALSDASGIQVYIDGVESRGSIAYNGDGIFTFAGTATQGAGTHTVYVTYSGDGYNDAQSDSKTVSLIQPEKPTLIQTADTNSTYQGAITITNNQQFSTFAYYRQGTSAETTVTFAEGEQRTITGLLGSSEAAVASVYYVYVKAQAISGEADYNYTFASAKSSIKVENNVVDTTVYYTIRFYDAYNYLIQTYTLAEGTSAEDIQIPKNTPENTDYRYEWPEIEDVSGNKDYYEIRIPKEGTVYEPFVAHSISLKGNIGLNFYLQLEDGVNAVDVTVHFTWGDSKTADVTLSENTKSQNGYYRAQVLLPASDQTYEVTATVNLNGIEYTNSYSIKTYADAILSGNYGNDVKELVKTMLNYGAYAQLQFNRNTDNLANAGLDYDLRPIDAAEINAEIPSIDQESLAEYGLRYVGYTLSLKSETVLRFFFSVTDEEKYSGVTLSLGDSTEVLPRGNYVYVEIADITAKDLDREYTLSVGEKALGAFSVLSYVKDVLADSSADEKLVNVVTALYRYNEAAKTYFSEQADGR